VSPNIRARLLALRAELDDLLAEAGAEPTVASARFMKIPDFAEANGYSARTVRDYCDLGMPHRGEGRARRVLVQEAIAWIDDGGPRKARANRKNGWAA
jgi:hypothetical protein